MDRSHRLGPWLWVAGVTCAFIGLPQANASGTGALHPLPRLGRAWSSLQIGYGSVKPVEIYNGGDASGVVTHIRWNSWDGGKAVGYGTAVYQPPVGISREARARVVAFDLGRCRGYRSYNAVQWYFPEYGQAFHRDAYINDCAGAFVEPSGTNHDCSDVEGAGDRPVATSVAVSDMSCAAGRALIASTTGADDTTPASTFVSRGFSCDTAALGTRLVFVNCQRGNRNASWTVAGGH
jgi:hypothetical protein